MTEVATCTSNLLVNRTRHGPEFCPQGRPNTDLRRMSYQELHDLSVRLGISSFRSTPRRLIADILAATSEEREAADEHFAAIQPNSSDVDQQVWRFRPGAGCSSRAEQAFRAVLAKLLGYWRCARGPRDFRWCGGVIGLGVWCEHVDLPPGMRPAERYALGVG